MKENELPWHKHLRRAFSAPGQPNGGPWHTHLYRSLLSFGGHRQYSPRKSRELLQKIADQYEEDQRVMKKSLGRMEARLDEISLEIGRARNQNNPTVLRHLAELTEAGDEVRTSFEFNFVAENLRPEITMRSRRIIVCTVAIGEQYRQSVAPCLESQQNYCARHGYSRAVLPICPNGQTRHPSWYKLPLAYLLMNLGYEHVFYLDADCLVTNQAFKAEDLLPKFSYEDRPSPVLLTADEAGINFGCFLAKRSAMAIRLFDCVWLYNAEVERPNWEQAALLRLVEDHEEFMNALCIEKNPTIFNSMPIERGNFHPCLGNLANIWSPGDFICHFSGIRPPHLERLIDQYSQKVVGL